MEIHAHAKINLSLRILNKRSDGFHELETVMSEISLYDTLSIETNDSGKLAFTCSRDDLQEDDNLVVRAVRLLEAASGKALGLTIHLEKRTPSGAGLGGGSSDAAATLKAVNELCDLALTQEQLLEMAAQLGSDVPFFLLGQPCLCQGRGEELTPHDIPVGIPIVLFKLPLSIPTPWAYKQWSTSKEIPDIPYDAQSSPWGDLVNDLERPAFEKYLILGQMKQWLLKQEAVQAALMTGSGSALFAVMKDGALASGLIDQASERYGEGLWTFSGQTMRSQ